MLDHTFRFRTRRRQTVLDTHPSADFFKHMSTCGLLVLCCKTISELGAIVSQDFADFNWQRVLQPAQEIDAASVAHVVINVQEDPARGSVDGREEMAQTLAQRIEKNV